jgi:5-methylcytosine-specific restriction enzyme A
MAWKVQTNRIKVSRDNRETSVERGYTSRWQRVRQMKQRRNPLCEDCAAEGRTTRMDLVHHIDGNPRHNTMENLVSLCRVCHGRRHSKDGQRQDHTTMGDKVGGG